MAASSIVVNSINPNLYILGDNQKLFFSDPTNNFSFISNFTPILNVPSLLKIGIFNVFNNGYVFEHLTTTVDNFGPLKLKSILNNNPVELLSINNNIFTFSVPVIVPNPTLNSHAANKYYIDNKTWTVSQITDFNSSVLAFKLNQFALPISNIDLNGNKIIGLGTPTLTTDAATKAYVDSSIGSISMSITLQGDVTGSGNTGANITTTLNKRLDQINLPTTSLNLNLQKIINLATPTLTTDGANKSYVDGKTWTASQITNFDTQVRLSRLDQMASPTTSLNANSQKIINLSSPTLSTDAVNKNYADTSTIAPSRITGYPTSSSVFLRGDGTWATPTGGGTTSYIIGEYKFIAGNTTPSGFLLCDGSSISRTTYSALFAVIGTSFGSTSGSTFNLPDLRGRVLSATDVSNPTGTYAGSNSIILTVAQMPQHNHTSSLSSNAAYTAPSANRYVGCSGGFNGWFGGYTGAEGGGDNNLIGATRRNGSFSYSAFDLASTHSHTVTINDSGSSSSVDIRQSTCYGGNYYIYTGV